jgi:DNA-binding NarL/FixJ family response regulator
MPRILIADDHPVVRRGLKQVVADAFPSVVIGEARDAAEAVEMVRNRPWDIVVLDITMPGRNGLEVLREVRREHPRLPILVLSMHPEEQFAVRAMKAGASGYLSKETAPDELVQAIRTTLAGRKYVTPSVAEHLAAALDSAGRAAPHETLSNREYAVLRMIAAGHRVGDIARTMHLSVKTVSTYRARLLRKMGLRTNADLVRYALDHGLVT